MNILPDGRVLVSGGYDGSVARAETYLGTILYTGIRI
jgi:hypothetical protein